MSQQHRLHKTSSGHFLLLFLVRRSEESEELKRTQKPEDFNFRFFFFLLLSKNIKNCYDCICIWSTILIESDLILFFYYEFQLESFSCVLFFCNSFACKFLSNIEWMNRPWCLLRLFITYVFFFSFHYFEPNDEKSPRENSFETIWFLQKQNFPKNLFCFIFFLFFIVCFELNLSQSHTN